MKKRAFTLIELLVVAAVITILGSMLVPAFQKAKVAANKATPLVNTPAGAVFEKPGKYVTDNTGTLSSEAQSALNERLATLERDTTAQVLVYAAGAVPANETLEALCNRTFKAWGVGQKGKNNGAVFFWFKDSRKIRLEVGYGLEGRIPDITAKSITAEAGRLFKAEKYQPGLERVVEMLDRLVREEAAGAVAKSSGVEAQRGFPFGSSRPSSSSSSSLPFPVPVLDGAAGAGGVDGITVEAPGQAGVPVPAGAIPVRPEVPVPAQAGMTAEAGQVAAAGPAATISGVVFTLGIVFACSVIALVAMLISGRKRHARELRAVQELAGASAARIDELRGELRDSKRKVSEIDSELRRTAARLGEINEPVWAQRPNSTGLWWFKYEPGQAAELLAVATLASLPRQTGFWAKAVVPRSEPIPVPSEAPTPAAEIRKSSRVLPAALAVATALPLAAVSRPASNKRRSERPSNSGSSWTHSRPSDSDSSPGRSDSDSSSSSSYSSGGGDSGGGGSSDSY